MKKVIALIGLAVLGIYFFYSPEKEPTFLSDEVVSIKAAISKKETPLPKVSNSVPKKVLKITKESDRLIIIGEILEKTSTINSLKSIDYIIDDRLKEAQKYLSPEQYAKLEKVLKKHFDGQKIVERISGHLAKNLSLEELKELKERTNDPFLNKVWSLEEYANSPEGTEAFQEYLVEVDKTPPAKERVALIKKFDEVAQGTESVVELNTSLIRGILEGSNTTLPKEEKIQKDEVEEMTAVLAEQIRDGLNDKVTKNLLFTYQELSDGDIKDLIKRSKNDSFSKTNDLILSELKKILLEGGQEIGKSNVHLN